MRRLAITLLLAAAAVFLAVWPHELGHATTAWLLGCKADPWRTETHWFLAGSRGGAIDQACLARQGGVAQGLTAGAGTAVNLLLAALALLLGRRRETGRTEGRGVRWALVAALLWSLANAAEALSYLIVNTLWPTSDMAVVIASAGVGRWPWTALGLLLGVVITRGLRAPFRSAAVALADGTRSERFWRLSFAAYALAVAAAAIASRSVFG
jgi:hypothetical protein